LDLKQNDINSILTGSSSAISESNNASSSATQAEAYRSALFVVAGIDQRLVSRVHEFQKEVQRATRKLKSLEALLE
jgi:hypothetical protein